MHEEGGGEDPYKTNSVQIFLARAIKNALAKKKPRQTKAAHLALEGGSTQRRV